MPPRPAVIDGLRWSEVEGGLALFAPDTEKVHYLNPPAAFVLQLCDGTRTAQELADLARRAFRLADAPLDDVRAVIAQADDLGLLRDP